MSEFKLTGTNYVSEWNGSSLNPGTNTSPYSHPNDAPNGNTISIIGAGVYFGTQTRYCRRHADGIVILDFNGLNNTGSPDYVQSFESPATRGIINLRCNNYQGNLANGAGISGWHVDSFFEINTWGNFYRNGDIFVRCILKSYTSGTIIKPTAGYIGNTFPNYVYNSIILDDINFTADRSPYVLFNYCYLPASKKIIGGALASVNGSSFIGSMINGRIVIEGIEYELKKMVDGSTRPDANPSVPDIVTIIPSIYTNGAFAGDPKFIDIYNKIVEPDSDLLKRSGIYGYIGGVRPGKRIAVNTSDPNVVINTANIDTTTDFSNWRIQSPATEGFITITWKISDNITEIQRLFLDALLTFRGSQAGGSIQNNNVPDIFPSSYSPLSQTGLKPNRLTYELRTSQSIAMPTIDSQWDNDNVTLGTTVGAYYIQEWNTKPTIIDALGVKYGNGSPQSIGGVSNAINARWAQARIRLTNNRSF